MGCRERSRNALLIPGARGAGIMTAGTAQRYLNIDGYLPGRRIVIVGSGDIGLIMARQFVLEGCEVAAVVEIMPYSGGLPRNMKQCIEDFDIPVYYNSVISEVRGKERVSSVLVGKVDESRRLIPGTEFEISCDTLLISAGLIPENELTESAGIAMSRATKGALVTLETLRRVRDELRPGHGRPPDQHSRHFFLRQRPPRPRPRRLCQRRRGGGGQKCSRLAACAKRNCFKRNCFKRSCL